jgi:predicted  nucleic acid-binding Zn-ribbon protein
MDAELKQYLEAKFGAIGAELGAIGAKFGAIGAELGAIKVELGAIKARLVAVDERLDSIDTKFKELEARIMERMDGRVDAVEERMKDYVKETVRDMETNVITEFHKWGRTSDMRTRQAITDTGFLGDRLLAVEDRVSALERGRST